MRNVAALNELADFMVSSRYKFNMGQPSAEPQCGSAGCIAGHAAVLWPEVRSYFEDTSTFTWNTPKLCAKLGISIDQYRLLFFGFHAGSDAFPGKCEDGSQVDIELLYVELTKAEAIAVVRRFASTGEVRWPDRFTAVE